VKSKENKYYTYFILQLRIPIWRTWYFR